MEITIEEFIEEQTLKLAHRAKSFEKMDDNTWKGDIIERFSKSKLKIKIMISKKYPIEAPTLIITNSQDFDGWKTEFFDPNTGEIKPKLIQEWNPSIDLYRLVYNLIHLFGFSYYPIIDVQEKYNRKDMNRIRVYFHDDDINNYITLDKFSKKTKSKDAIQKKCCICLNEIKLQNERFICPSCGAIGHRDHFLEWLKVKSACPTCQQPLLFSEEHSIKCKNCENNIENDSIFCSFCGYKV